MEIQGHSYQEKEPTPTEPVEIKNFGYIPAIYENKECKIIGQNYYHYLISYLDKKNNEVKEIVPKGKVEIFREEED